MCIGDRKIVVKLRAPFYTNITLGETGASVLLSLGGGGGSSEETKTKTTHFDICRAYADSTNPIKYADF